jgi:hypothetical protein
MQETDPTFRDKVLFVCHKVRYYSVYNKAYKAILSSAENISKGKYAKAAASLGDAVEKVFESIEKTIKPENFNDPFKKRQ